MGKYQLGDIVEVWDPDTQEWVASRVESLGDALPADYQGHRVLMVARATDGRLSYGLPVVYAIPYGGEHLIRGPWAYE